MIWQLKPTRVDATDAITESGNFEMRMGGKFQMRLRVRSMKHKFQAGTSGV